MEIGVEQLLVGLVMLVPGFVASTTEGIFQPRRFESNFEWTASSLLRSILLNSLGIACLALFVADLPHEKIGDVRYGSRRTSRSRST